MARPEGPFQFPRTFSLIGGVTVIAILYFGREVLLPFALAVLLSFLLAPAVERLERWKLGRIPSVLIMVTALFLGLGVLSYVAVQQLYDLAKRLPDYKENIAHKVELVRSNGDGALSSISNIFNDIRSGVIKNAAPASSQNTSGQPLKSTAFDNDDANGNQESKPRSRIGSPSDPVEDVAQMSGNGKTQEPVPVPVEVVNPISAREVATGFLGPLLSPLGNAAIVIVFVIFILLEREDLRNRLIRLVGSRQLNLTTQALDDAAFRVSRYLQMQLLINASYGIVIALGLFFIGLPNAVLWGVMTAVLRFVPYVGPWIAATIPLLLSLAVFDDWTRPILVLALFLFNELISNNVMEPWLYGASTGISTIGILVSAVFWTWIWGPVGLVMATPLTVCFTVLGKYVPQMAFLNTLLSDHQVLPAHSRFYQRLLAQDPEEAIEVAEEFLKTGTLEALYDSVILPALSLAEQDRHRGELDDAKQQFICQTVRELVDDLGSRAKQLATDSSESHALPNPAPEISVLCLPARDEADEIAALMFAQLMQAKGIGVEVASTRTLASEMLTRVAENPAGVVCVSALPPFAATHARYLCKRLRPKFPKLKIVVGLWTTAGSGKKAQERLTETGIDRFVTTLQESVEQATQFSASQKLNGNHVAENRIDAYIAQPSAATR
ncbi:MAG: AI-2E family transporter [Planctomycetia bacterium]|nr:AI-2E family transporter [Planctomycetia bacterium]